MWTPFSISLLITALDFLKSWLSVSSQWNGVPGLSNWRNGSMQSVTVKAFDTRLMRPNQECISVRWLVLGSCRWCQGTFYMGAHCLE